LWATETNKFSHCIKIDLFAAIFPTFSQYCTPEQISINIMDKVFFPYQQNWSKTSKDGFLWYKEMGTERGSMSVAH
jgi:hypothetical protein